MTQERVLLDKKAIKSVEAEVGTQTVLLLLESLKGEIQNGKKCLPQYYVEDNMHMLVTQAHALKSAANSFGAMQLGDICRALEEGAKKDLSHASIASLLNQFEATSTSTLTHLDELLGSWVQEGS